MRAIAMRQSIDILQLGNDRRGALACCGSCVVKERKQPELNPLLDGCILFLQNGEDGP